MFRIATLNANGIRSATRKGLVRWIERSMPDVCLQEVKAEECDIPTACRPRDMHAWFHCAARRGYAGTAIFSRQRPLSVRLGFGSIEFDAEGRYVEAQFKDLAVISVYFPSDSSGPHRHQAKYRFLAAFSLHLQQLAASGKDFILCGDINIAHREIDLKNGRSNQKHSGFLPEERQWLSRVFDQGGWVDVFRCSIRARIDTRGGATSGRHTQTMLDGASTIKSPHPELPSVPEKPRFTCAGAFRTTLR